MGSLRLTLKSGETLCALEWPAHLDAEAHAFLRDNLFAERCGSPRAAQKLLDAGVLRAADRTRFLADRPYFRPEPPERLASELELEDFVAEFGVGLEKLRAAPPDAELVIELTLSASAPPAVDR